MAFDIEKVQFSEEDLFAGKALDSIFEELKEGVDLSKVLAQVGNVQIVVSYLTNEGNDKIAERVIALGMMFARDNLDELLNPPVPLPDPVV
jgi:hypothetical protein